MADDEILDEDEEEELNFVAIFVAAAIVLALIGGVVWYFFIRKIRCPNGRPPRTWARNTSLIFYLK